MILEVDRTFPFLADEPICPRQEAYYRQDTLRVESEDADSLALGEVDVDDIVLVEIDVEDKSKVIALDVKFGEAICRLPQTEQNWFWKILEPQVDAFCSQFIYPEKTKESFGIYLDGTIFFHKEDVTDECRASITRDENGRTVLRFISIVGFAPPYPGLAIPR